MADPSSVAAIGTANGPGRQRLAIIGSGVVGTATGLGFAAAGHPVTFCDLATDRLALLRSRGLRAVDPEGLLLEEFDSYFISVPSPTVRGRVELGYVLAAARTVGRALASKGHAQWPLVVVRSTVPPGTTEGVVREALEVASGLTAGQDFGLCMNPEFLRELSAESDFMNPRVIVIGALDRRSERALRRIYEGWEGVAVVSLGLRAAELAKYTSNLFNAAKISFFNELEEVALALGVDPRQVFAAVAAGCEGMWNPQYGTRGLAPFGGACLPKDTAGFLGFAEDVGLAAAMPMLRATLETNERIASRQVGAEASWGGDAEAL
jgi:UDPglucose 6-dehydrogenase